MSCIPAEIQKHGLCLSVVFFEFPSNKKGGISLKRFFSLLILACLIALLLSTSAPLTASAVSGGFVTITPSIQEVVIPNLTLETNSVSVTTTPLYRLKSPSGIMRHNYTSNESERTYLKDLGWLDDGLVAHISPVPLPGFMPLYKCTFANWVNVLTLFPGDAVSHGYVIRGIVGYVYAPTTSISGTAMIFRHTRPIPTAGDYHYMDYYFVASSAAVPGYTILETKFKGYTNQTTLQQVTVGALSSSLTGGQTVAVTWSTTVNSGAIELLYSTDNGASYTSIAKGLANTTGSKSYSWKVPNLSSTQARLMVKWSTSAYTPATAWARTQKFTIVKDTGLSLILPLLPKLELMSFIPAEPSGLTTEAGTTATKEISLFWHDNATNETAFKIERKTEGGSFAQIGTVAANTTTYTDLTVNSKTTYLYRVKASGSITDSGYSNEAEGTYVSPGFSLPDILPDFDFEALFPSAPINLTGEKEDDGSVDLSWDEGTGGTEVTSFIIQRKTGSDWEDIGTTDGDQTYTDANASAFSQIVYYRVKAVSESFESAPSNQVELNLSSEEVTAPAYDGTQSDWAEPEITQAYDWGLTYSGIMGDFQKKITREEFCVISVKLYEKLSGNTAVAVANPFLDTANADILKAYGLGIVKGLGEGRFAPNNNITRQEMCVMIYRALQAAGEATTLLPGGTFSFSDQGNIASWAIDEVKFCNQNEIMKGTSLTTISPLVNTPREQAIVMIKRTYDQFK